LSWSCLRTRAWEEVLRGLKYRVVGSGVGVWERIARVRARHVRVLGGPSNMEEYGSLEEELWIGEL